MFEVLKIHFYLFSREPEIGSHMHFTQNCGYDSEKRKYSVSKGRVVQICSSPRVFSPQNNIK